MRESEKERGGGLNSGTERTKDKENTEHSEMHGADRYNQYLFLQISFIINPESEGRSFSRMTTAGQH